MRALQVTGSGSAAVGDSVPEPELRNDYVLARTKAVALNPTDYRHLTGLSEPGTVLGRDWSGVVLEVGKDITRFKPGDEVSGCCRGGAFAETVTSKELATMHKPASLSFEQAATLGAGIATAGQILYYVWQWPLPSAVKPVPLNSKGPILVYGGSSATGTLLIQLAKLSGFTVYTTCSPPNFELVKSRGADEAFDYSDHQSISQVGQSFNYVVDCICNDASAGYCADIVSTTGPSFYHSVKMPLPDVFKKVRTEQNVQATSALAGMLLGEDISFNGRLLFPADPKQEAFGKRWAPVVEELINTEKLKPHPPVVIPGGLEAIPEQLEKVANGGTRGKKTVFTVGRQL